MRGVGEGQSSDCKEILTWIELSKTGGMGLGVGGGGEGETSGVMSGVYSDRELVDIATEVPR